jgi:hypothetical protein
VLKNYGISKNHNLKKEAPEDPDPHGSFNLEDPEPTGTSDFVSTVVKNS